jgi:hypothetical protein
MRLVSMNAIQFKSILEKGGTNESRSYMHGIGLTAAVGVGLRIYGPIIVHSYGMRLTSCYGKSEIAVKMVSAAPITANICSIHAYRIASHVFGCNEYLSIASRLRSLRIGWVSGLWIAAGIVVWRIIWGIDIDVDVVAPAIAVVLKSVPSCRIAIKPHLLPAWIAYGSHVFANQPSIRIPFIHIERPGSTDIQPHGQPLAEVAPGHGRWRIGNVKFVWSCDSRRDYHVCARIGA